MPEPIIVQGPSKETTVTLSGPPSTCTPPVTGGVVKISPIGVFTRIVASTKNDGEKILTILSEDNTWSVRIE
jgi:hypothetical protein